MFPIFCNNCFRKRNAKHSFQLNRCYHVICSKCIPKTSESNKCPVCKQPTKGIAITRDMPSNVANYFQDPDVYLKMYRSISKFQCDQRTLRYKHYYEQQKGLAIKQDKLQGYLKLEEQLRQQIDIEKKRIVELRNYAAYYDRKDMANGNSSSSDISGNSRRMCRPPTPTFSASELSITDNDAELSDNCLKQFEQLVTKAATSSQTAFPTKMKSNMKKAVKVKDQQDFGL